MKLICIQCNRLLTRSTSCSRCKKRYIRRNGIFSFIKKNRLKKDFYDNKIAKTLARLEDKHFWFKGRREIIFRYLKDIYKKDLRKITLLEIGCSNGSVLLYLAKNGIRITGLDYLPSGLAFCRKKNKKVDLFRADAFNMPFGKNSFDTVGIFDMLEHVENDVELLKKINKILKPQGFIFVTVPAHSYLWSYADDYANHKRRYGRDELISKLKKAGFKTKKVSYYIFLLYPIFLLYRLLNSLGPKKKKSLSQTELNPPEFINKIFLSLVRADKHLMNYFNLPWGTSLIVVAQKRK